MAAYPFAAKAIEADSLPLLIADSFWHGVGETKRLQLQQGYYCLLEQRIMKSLSTRNSEQHGLLCPSYWTNNSTRDTG